MEPQQQRRVTSVRQLEMLLEFLQTHRELALGRLKSKEFLHTANRLWCEVAELLNPFGAERTGKEWAKVWNNQKCKVRSKLTAINSAQRGTGGGPCETPELTPIESRIANIIGLDVGPLLGVMQDQFHEGDNGNDNDSEQEQEVEIETQIIIQDEPVENDEILVDYADADSYDEGQGPSHQDTPVRPSARRGAIRTPQASQASRGVERTQEIPPASQTRRGAIGTPQASQASRGVERTQEIPPASQTSRSALDRSREMVLRVEELRAQSDLNNSQAFNTIADALKMLAESADRLTRLFCSQQTRDPE